MAISDKVYELTHATDTVQSVLAQDPSQAVGDVAEKLYKVHAKDEGKIGAERMKVLFSGTADRGAIPTKEELDRTAECGKFGRRPSDLFLKVCPPTRGYRYRLTEEFLPQMYHDVLQTLDDHPLVGVVSPPLIGSRGVLPLSVISV